MNNLGLIYVLKAEEEKYTDKYLEEIISHLLYKDGIKTDKINSDNEEERKKHLGKIGEFYNNDNTGKPQCGIKLEEWIRILQAIEKDENLCSLKIHDVTSEESSGFRAATFTSDTENIIIFKGTTEVEEWLDNGVGGYSVETPVQERALDYVNKLNLVNNNPFTVSGHSKGGNLAQYVTLFASDPVIDKCLSLDGQGFSTEACERTEYKEALKRNQDKMYMISSSGDYVNVLFNSAILDKNKMYVKANPVGINVPAYHNPNNVFEMNSKGEILDLNQGCCISLLSYFIQDFVAYMLETESDVSKKQTVCDSLMSMMAAIASNKDEMELFNLYCLINVVEAITDDKVQEVIIDSDPLNPINYLCAAALEVLYEARDVIEELVFGDYQGEIYDFFHSGAAELVAQYMKSYVATDNKNFFTIVYAMDDLMQVKSWNVAGKFAVQELIETMEKKYHFDRKDLVAELAQTYSASTTLGEETQGNIYTDTNEYGGLDYRGTGGSDSVAGTEKDDALHGGNGTDVLNGKEGDDTLFGGRGDDILYGGSGNNVYSINQYDGIDRIFNTNAKENINFILFGDGINPEKVIYRKDGNDLYIQYNEEYLEECQVIVQGFFLADSEGNLTNAIDAIVFRENRAMVTVEDIFSIVGYEGPTGKTMIEKVEAMDAEQRRKILAKHEFLEMEYAERMQERFENLKADKDEKEEIWDAIYKEYLEETKEKSETTDATGKADATEKTETTATPEELENSDASTVVNTATADVINLVNEAEQKLLGRFRDTFYKATINTYVDPIVIDLNGDGVFTTSLEQGTHFDFNGDGFAEKTAWTSFGDGLLVRDVNGNGTIDNGTELFGDQTILKNGSIATSGYEALADVNDNQDDVIDSKDSSYQELKVWMDFNQDGKSQKWELFSLNQMGIISIDLAHNVINKMDSNGNLIKSQGVVGGIANCFNINEYGFSIDYVDTEYRGEEIDTSNLDDSLPKLKGCGTLLDLSQAMVLDESLKKLVTSYMEEKNLNHKNELAQQILYRWAGVEEIDPNSRGGHIDARNLVVLEKVYGRDFVGLNGPNPIVGAANILNDLYSEVIKDVRESLLVQTVYKEYLHEIEITYNKETKEYQCDFATVLDKLASEYPAYYIAYFTTYLLDNSVIGKFFDRNYIYKQMNKKDTVLASYVFADDSYALHFGDEKNNTLNGKSGNDLLIGYEGNDAIYGGDGDDILNGGAGNDYLNGGYGSDTYLYNRGDGADRISDWDYNGTDVDIVMFGEGIRKEDIVIQRDRQDLVLKIKENGEETTDSIRVDDYFYESIQEGEAKYCGAIEKFQFSDGNVLELEEIKKAVQVISEGDDIYYDYGAGEKDRELHMGAGNDTVYANNGDDVVYGELGDDMLYGESGNDTLYGGEGNDYLDGGEGNDLLYGGAGNDTIYAGDGVDVIYGGAGNDYVNAGWGDDYLYGEAGNDSLDGGYGSDYIEGGEGNDTIYGGDGADTIIGGTGNDYLNGGYGSDIYLYNRGDGADRINDWDYYGTDVDIVMFGEGIRKEDIVIQRDRQDLVLKIKENGEETTDSIRVDGYFYESIQEGEAKYCGAIEKFQFSDGNVLELEEIKKAVQVISEGDDIYYDYGAGEKDRELHMGAGNDTVYANNGDDVVYGELGDDTLYGESGNDTLYGGEGNDYLDGGYGNDLLYGELGNDTIYAGDGADVIYGGEGNDYVSAGYGDDRLYGEAGNDTLDGGYGSDYIEGGAGNDTIYGEEGADTIIGGIGNDYLNGGYGSDIYLYNRGDGADRINDWDYNVNNVDTISFGANISKSDIVASREYQDLVLQIQQNGENTGDSIRIDYYYSEDTQNGNPVYRNAVEQFTFENGDTTTLSDILSLELTSGGEGVALYEEPTVLEQSALLVQNMASYDDSAMMTTNNFDTLTTENTEYVENIWVK